MVFNPVSAPGLSRRTYLARFSGPPGNDKPEKSASPPPEEVKPLDEETLLKALQGDPDFTVSKDQAKVIGTLLEKTVLPLVMLQIKALSTMTLLPSHLLRRTKSAIKKEDPKP